MKNRVILYTTSPLEAQISPDANITVLAVSPENSQLLEKPLKLQKPGFWYISPQGMRQMATVERYFYQINSGLKPQIVPFKQKCIQVLHLTAIICIGVLTILRNIIRDRTRLK